MKDIKFLECVPRSSLNKTSTNFGAGFDVQRGRQFLGIVDNLATWVSTCRGM
jgi:hypothetical protein